MVRFARVFAWVLAAAVVAAPLAAAVYTVTLKNGNTFETRYEPEDASWDKEKVVFVDEVGNTIALLRADIESIVSDVAAKGYGSVLDNTTIALGWAPNDAAEPGAAPGGGAETAAAVQPPPINQEQFVEPDQLQGITGTWISYPSAAPPQMAPAPMPAPAPPPSGAEQ
jgi:hypothetical protein